MPQTNSFLLFFRTELLELCFLYSLPHFPALMALALFFNKTKDSFQKKRCQQHAPVPWKRGWNSRMAAIASQEARARAVPGGANWEFCSHIPPSMHSTNLQMNVLRVQHLFPMHRGGREVLSIKTEVLPLSPPFSAK